MPQQRILPYVILGILNKNDYLNGIQIASEFKHDIGEFWRSSHSQIYPELKRMLEDGWIQVVAVKDDNDKEIHYQITPEGKQVLETWLAQPHAIPMPSKDLFSLKMYFIQDKNDPKMARLIEEQKALVKENVKGLEARRKLLFSTQEEIDQNYGHYLILDRAISRQKNYLRWLKKIEV